MAGAWSTKGSNFMAHAVKRGLAAEEGDGRPFVWSTDLNGFQFWRRLLGRKPGINDWIAGAENLHAWAIPPMAPTWGIPANQTNVITHSHGLQVAIIAAAHGLKIHTLIDVCGPVRHDIIEDYGKAARENIGYWIHCYTPGDSDPWQVLGGLGDSDVGSVRRHPLASTIAGRGENYSLSAKCGHSGVLNNPALFSELNSALQIMVDRHGRDDIPAGAAVSQGSDGHGPS